MRKAGWLIRGLHFKESTFDKKGEESRVKSHPVVSPWTCCECGEHFISEMARDQHARKKHEILVSQLYD